MKEQDRIDHSVQETALHRALAGRDAVIPRWLSDGPPDERPRFDSVVIRGSGIGALTCAARLSRSDSLRGRVTLASPLPRIERRLVNGCTLRARALDYFGAALGLPRETLVGELFGAAQAQAESHSQLFTMARRPKRQSGYRLLNLAEWMAEREQGERVLAYGIRNSHLVELLHTHLQSLDHVWTEDLPMTLKDCRAIAQGDNPLVINATFHALEGAPAAGTPSAFVAASQLTLRRQTDSSLPVHAAFQAGIRARHGLDVGVYYPFADPLTPQADYYGIFYRIIPPQDGARVKEETIALLRETVVGVGRAAGLEPIDADDTRGEALIPCFPWQDFTAELDGFLDLHRTLGSCIPIITGDGMARAGLGGWIAAEAVLAGEDPSAVVNASLVNWRYGNWLFAAAMTKCTRISSPILRRFPAPILRAIADRPDSWAAVT